MQLSFHMFINEYKAYDLLNEDINFQHFKDFP